MSRRVSALWFVPALLALLPAVCPGAPFFRHALEHQPPSDYEVIVFHRGSLADEPQGWVDALQEARSLMGANAAVRTVDVAGQMDKSMEDLWTCQQDPQPPWVVVRAPETSADAAPVWTGQLTAATIASLVDSPARRKITEALLRGVTAVWVLLECGEAARDEAAVDVLSSNLKTLERKIQLAAEGPLRSPLKLRTDFELVRVTRSDPAEEFFVTLLEHGKPAFSSRPVAYPVFGRGRTLGALVGREIDAEGIGNVCAMLTGAAGEGRPPGRDLLLAADWQKIFQPPVVPPPSAPEPAVPAAVAPGPALSQPAASPAMAAWVWVAGVAMLGAGALSFYLLRKTR